MQGEPRGSARDRGDAPTQEERNAAIRAGHDRADKWDDFWRYRVRGPIYGVIVGMIMGLILRGAGDLMAIVAHELTVSGLSRLP